jgi:protein TonB
VGGNVQRANLIRQVRPRYPALAKQARIQGTVILEAVISKRGSVENLKVVKGHPLLIQSALNAVKQWRYRPTVLNGVPVEVITRITVNFNLRG